jgi:Family of unknown function (DUF6447)
MGGVFSSFACMNISIDNQDYDLSNLSNEARVRLASIQLVDAELARLQAQIAPLQTAPNTYAHALRQLLPPTSDKIQMP